MIQFNHGKEYRVCILQCILKQMYHLRNTGLGFAAENRRSISFFDKKLKRF
jgi:hypothetical protein